MGAIHLGTSVRGRLLAGVLGLVAVGLVTVDVASWTSLRAFLVGRLDAQLAATASPIEGELEGQLSLADVSADPSGVRRAIPPGVFVELRSGLQVVVTVSPSDKAGNPVDPSLPDPVPAAGRVVTVASAGGEGGSFRLAAFAGRFSTVTVVALSLAPVDATLHRLLLVELVASALILTAVAGLALAVIRVGLQPLDAMARIAGAIAEGDLSRRVPGSGPSSEVGRLGIALNAMLGQIEVAFSRRQASEERLRRFVSDASHELRTPLTSIRGYAELFRSGASRRPDDLATAMGRIESEAARMGGLVEDLLLLASLDQGRPLRIKAVDLALVASDAVSDASVRCAHPVTAEVPDAVWVAGDEARLRQVAANLVTNAVVHTPVGTPVTVRARVEDGFGVLEVADSGPGLAPDEADRVWDRFWRAARTPASGSGLGLPIVAAIAAAHGGRATVSSTPGQGTMFRVEIPMADGPAP